MQAAEKVRQCSGVMSRFHYSSYVSGVTISDKVVEIPSSDVVYLRRTKQYGPFPRPLAPVHS